MSSPNIKNRFVGSELLTGSQLDQTFIDIADTFDATIGQGLETGDFIDQGIREENIAISGLPASKLMTSAVDADTHLAVEAISSAKLQQTSGTGMIRDYHLKTTGTNDNRIHMVRFPNFADVDTEKVVLMMGYVDHSIGETGTATGSVLFADDSIIGTGVFISWDGITVRAGVKIQSGLNMRYISDPVLENLTASGFDYSFQVKNLGDYQINVYRFIWVATGRIAQ